MLEFVAIAGRRLLARRKIGIPDAALARRREMPRGDVAAVKRMSGSRLVVDDRDTGGAEQESDSTRGCEARAKERYADAGGPMDREACAH
jgi:hypothetical protein